MAKFLWASFDGGGNVPPALGISRSLIEAGHEVTFVGRPEMLLRVRPAGFDAMELRWSYTHADRYSWHRRGRLFSYLSSPLVGDELLAVVTREQPDAVVVDAMFGAALAVAPHFGVPTAAVMHTLFHRTLDGWREMMWAQSEARLGSGFEGLPSLEKLWGDLDLLQANTLAKFDTEPLQWWHNLRYGWPIFQDDNRSVPVRLPWPQSDPTPLVLVSFSTADVQISLGKLQRTLDALAGLPVHVVATTSDNNIAKLRIADNAYVVPFATHGPLMRRASLVVTHGGHGTVMRALSHGLPMVCVTGKAADQEAASFDQEPVANLVEEYGVGRSVPAEASVAQIRAAIRAVLEAPEARRKARSLAGGLMARDGATEAAGQLTALLSLSRSQSS
ncbi:MAG: nucleotide disphospho-sugar-binding domain-containing protein [Kibdelosporangium sp.]